MTSSTHANDATSTASAVGLGRKNETDETREKESRLQAKRAEAKAPPAPFSAERDARTRRNTEIVRKHAVELSRRVVAERSYAKGIFRHPEYPAEVPLITRNDLALGEARYEQKKRAKDRDRRDAEKRAEEERARREAAERALTMKRLGAPEEVVLATTSSEPSEGSSPSSSLPLLVPSAFGADDFVARRSETVDPDKGADAFTLEMEEAFPALRTARLEANRSAAEYSRMSLAEKRTVPGEKLREKVKLAQKTLERLSAIADIFKEIRPLLHGNLLDGDASLAQGMARVGLRVLCRDDGIEVRFDGSIPSTDGKVIRLGRIDFSNPLGVIYAWGSGIHERNHVLYSDFGAVRDLKGFALFLTNVFEDIRVDALGDRDLAGYRIWRNALYRVLSTDPSSGFLRAEGLKTPALVAAGWFWALLTETVLEFKLPARLREKTARRADELFGADFRKSTEAFVLERFPLEDTCAARALAFDILESFGSEASNLALMLKSEGLIEDSDAEAIDLMIENFNAHGNSNASDEEDDSDEGRTSARGRRSGRSKKESFDDADSADQPTLFGLDGSVTGAAAPEGADSPEAKLERLRALRTIARESERAEDFPDPIAPMLRKLVAEVTRKIPETEFESEAEQLAAGLAAGRRFADAYRSCGYVPERDAYAAWKLHPGRDANALEARIAFHATEELRTKTFGFGAALLDDIRRPVTRPVRAGTDGWNLVEDATIRLRTGNPRVFAVRGRTPGFSVALQIAVDLSGSVTPETGAILKCAACRLEEVFKQTTGLAARTAVFPTRYRTGVIAVSDWDTPVDDTFARIAPIPGRGPTPVQEAAFWGLEGLSGRREERRILFVFSDGRFPAAQLEGYADELRMSGIELGLLLVGRSPDPDRAGDVAPGDDIYGCPTVFVDRAEALPKGVRLLVKRTLDAGAARGRRL